MLRVMPCCITMHTSHSNAGARLEQGQMSNSGWLCVVCHACRQPRSWNTTAAANTALPARSTHTVHTAARSAQHTPMRHPAMAPAFAAAAAAAMAAAVQLAVHAQGAACLAVKASLFQRESSSEPSITTCYSCSCQHEQRQHQQHTGHFYESQ